MLTNRLTILAVTSRDDVYDVLANRLKPWAIGKQGGAWDNFPRHSTLGAATRVDYPGAIEKQTWYVPNSPSFQDTIRCKVFRALPFDSL